MDYKDSEKEIVKKMLIKDNGGARIIKAGYYLLCDTFGIDYSKQAVADKINDQIGTWFVNGSSSLGFNIKMLSDDIEKGKWGPNDIA